MDNQKINPYWFELNNIIKALVKEVDKKEGIDWSNVFAQAQDLMAISYTALQQSRNKK